MDNTDYITILGWMKRLQVSLVEKMVFSIIYGFSKDRRSDFRGTRQYLADWCECSTKTIDRALASLCASGYIIKREEEVEDVKFCHYQVNFALLDKMSIPRTICPEGCDNLSKTEDKLSHNIIVDNGDNKLSPNKDNNAQSAQPRPFDFKNALRKMGVSEQHASDWMAVRKAKRMTNTRTAFDRLKAHIERACKQYTVTPDDCVAFAASKDWGGFDSSWEAIKEITKNNTLNEDDRVRRAYAAAEAKFKGDLHF